MTPKVQIPVREPVRLTAVQEVVSTLIPEPAPARYLQIPMWVLAGTATAPLAPVWLISLAAPQPSLLPTKAVRLLTARCWAMPANAGWTGT